MNKKGFSFIETIVTIVVLSAALILLYNSYSGIITSEDKRLYYDDPAYLYKTNYVKKFLINKTNVENIKNRDFLLNDRYILTIGTGYSNMCNTENDCKSLSNIYSNFKISQIILVDSAMFFACDGTKNDNYKCDLSLNHSNISKGMKDYLKSLNSIDYTYYLVIEYVSGYVEEEDRPCDAGMGLDENCKAFYASVGI